MGLNTTRERLLDRQRKASVATQKAAEETKTSQDAANALLTSIKTAVELLDNAISGSEMQVDIVSGAVTATLSATDNAVLDTIDERLDRVSALHLQLC